MYRSSFNLFTVHSFSWEKGGLYKTTTFDSNPLKRQILSTTTLLTSFWMLCSAFWFSILTFLSSELISFRMTAFCVRMQMSLSSTFCLRRSSICFLMHLAPHSTSTLGLVSESSHFISNPHTSCPNSMGFTFGIFDLKYFFDCSKTILVLLKTFESQKLFLIDSLWCWYWTFEILRFWLVSYKNQMCLGSHQSLSSSSSSLSSSSSSSSSLCNLLKRVGHLSPQRSWHSSTNIWSYFWVNTVPFSTSSNAWATCSAFSWSRLPDVDLVIS